MTEDYWVSISNYSVDPTGVLDSYGGLMSALSASSDDVVIPKGVYLIGQNTAIPLNKKLIFGRNARLKPANGVTITINGTWVASDDDWIFDMSLGGVFTGNPKIDKVYPHWFGAKGDGVTDDAPSFQAANDFCGKRLRMYLLGLTYKLKSSISINCRGIVGSAAYIDSGMMGTVLSFDPTDKVTDLLPCLNISGGSQAVFENFSVRGNKDFGNLMNMSNWINKTDFEQSLYSMFAIGAAGISVESGAPVFRNIETSKGLKCGLVLNNNSGHISTFNCGWSGMFGMYCRKNNGDYLFQGGSIIGGFCGLLLGTKLAAGHRGGFGGMINQVNMGFSPYGVYQCIEDLDDYNSVSDVTGISGTFKAAQFEVCGEAAIKLLPNSKSGNFLNEGFGFSWSSDIQDNGSWKFAIPDSIIPAGQKQKYAAYFGTLTAPVQFGTTLSTLKKSISSGALGSALIENITSSDGNLLVDLAGLGKDVVIKRKSDSMYSSMDLQSRISERPYKSLNVVSPSNLLMNPEVVTNWSINNNATLTIVDKSQVPSAITTEMMAILGDNPIILKLTPNGVTEPHLKIKFKDSPLPVDPNRNIFMSYFVLTALPEWVGTNYATSAIINSSRPENEKVFISADYYKGYGWRRKVGIEGKTSGGFLEDLSVNFKSKTQPTYYAGFMVTYDSFTPYSPYSYPFVDGDLGIGNMGNGLVMVDSSTGQRSKVVLRNNAVQIEGSEIKTKIYSYNGVPYKLIVADDGTLSTELDALVYDSFDRDDSTTSLGTASTIGGAWNTVSGVWGISSNEAYSATMPGSTVKAILSSGVGATNYKIGCAMKGQLTSSTDYSRPGIMFKWANTDNHFWVEFTNNALQLCKRIASMDTVVTSISYTPIDNKYYKMVISVKDNVISVYVDGDLKLSYKLSPSDIAVVGLFQIVGLRYRGYGTPTTIAKFNNFVVEKI